MDKRVTKLKNSFVVIKAGSLEKNYLKDMWIFRELVYALAWRDISSRYKQTFIGLFWAVIRPLSTMIILVVIFGSLAKLPNLYDAPYPLVVMAGLLPWQFFSTGMLDVAESFTANSTLISKVYFPRLVMPIASLGNAIIELCIGFLLIFLMFIWYQYLPTTRLLMLPFFIVMAILSILGPGLLIASLNVKYRDFRYVIPFIVQMGMYISPVGFSSQLVSGYWQYIYSLNPMVGIINGFRWSLLRGDQITFDFSGFIVSCTVILFFLWIGIRQFVKMEKTFADLI